MYGSVEKNNGGTQDCINNYLGYKPIVNLDNMQTYDLQPTVTRSPTQQLVELGSRLTPATSAYVLSDNPDSSLKFFALLGCDFMANYSGITGLGILFIEANHLLQGESIDPNVFIVSTLLIATRILWDKVGNEIGQNLSR